MSGHPSADSVPGNESQGWWFQLTEHTLLTLDFVWVAGGFGQPSLYVCVCVTVVSMSVNVCVRVRKRSKGDLVNSDVCLYFFRTRLYLSYNDADVHCAASRRELDIFSAVITLLLETPLMLGSILKIRSLHLLISQNEWHGCVY